VNLPIVTPSLKLQGIYTISKHLLFLFKRVLVNIISKEKNELQISKCPLVLHGKPLVMVIG